MDLRPLLVESKTKILFVIADGLGGIDSEGRGTELEAARTPNLDRLAQQGATGLIFPVAPGSGPGHLGLFGYDPVEHNIGRGVLTALGIGFDLAPGDVAARGNFCTLNSRGEDGDFDGKVAAIEELDRVIPRLVELQPDVIVVTGDHSTPSALASHSWHPVPVLISANTCRVDGVEVFGETACASGGLGHFLAKDLMALALAHAGRLQKFGA